MQPEFWHERWKSHNIGFHRNAVMPLLQRHWPSLNLPSGSQVLVPLAGKTLDMAWLASQGYNVLGVELSPLAIKQFFDEHNLTPQMHTSRYGTHYVAGNIELICGNVFELNAALLSQCAGIYDRAALIALPAPMRQRYAHSLYASLPSHCQGLMITLEYPQAKKNGPPFAVLAKEVHGLYDPMWQVDELDRRDILSHQPDFIAEGVTALSTVVYHLQKR